MAGDSPLIIKRIKKSGGEGHHGGAWKVAYADFVTAMMAFFLLMWLINTTTPEQKRGIADYFAAQNISRSQSGAGGVLGGVVFGTDGARAGGRNAMPNKVAQPSGQENSPPTNASTEQTQGAGQGQGSMSDSQEMGADAMQAQMPSTEDHQFERAEISLRQAMQQMPDIAELSRSVIVEKTPEGLNIQLTDQDGQSMFQTGTANLTPKARLLLEQVAKIVDRLPNRVLITGHTDAQAFVGANGMTNWELSAARANAARAVLALQGLPSDRIYSVAGKAGTEPLLPDNPYASSNRRIAILLMREAPVVPPGHKL
jgi:chemotaxis protein MotB